MTGPRVLLLDGGAYNSLTIAKELSADLGATVIAVGTNRFSRVHRSKYCDVGVVAPPVSDSGYADRIVELIERHHPDFVLPVGFESSAELVRARDELPETASTCLPPLESFRAAADKETTLQSAEAIGLDTPSNYTRVVEQLDDAGRPADRVSELDFPLFLKPRWETGGGQTATSSVTEPQQFWETYDRIARDSPGGEVLVQERIDGSRETYGCGLFIFEDDVQLAFGHEECRSVPRRGGSGTHLRIVRDSLVERNSIELLREIGWHGIALVEFKKRANGSYVLMEVNPKFWASYALASTHGYRFASSMVATSLDLERQPTLDSPNVTGEMVFPLRELYFYARNRRDERLLDSLATVFRPGATWSIDRTDLPAWLTPPESVLQNVPFVSIGDEERAAQEPEPAPLKREADEPLETRDSP